eukprot:14155954-Heterocapsa_arctica.AAC.1
MQAHPRPARRRLSERPRSPREGPTYAHRHCGLHSARPRRHPAGQGGRGDRARQQVGRAPLKHSDLRHQHS